MLSDSLKYFLFFCISLSSLVGTQKCGESSTPPIVDFATKIINGTEAFPYSWPWIVSLRYGTISQNAHFCGGSLIDSTTVVTAAHCLDRNDFSISSSDFIVVVGTNYLDEKLVQGLNAFKVRNFKIHWGWEDGTFLNDIAIIKLTKPVNFSTKIQPICLPTSFKIKVVYNKDLIVAGWGAISGIPGKDVLPNNLLQAKLRVVTNSTLCQGLQIRNYCAIDLSERKSNTCQGDSGGPLMHLIDGKWYLYGIVSYGFGNDEDRCFNFHPSFYTRVPTYLNWISRNL